MGPAGGDDNDGHIKLENRPLSSIFKFGIRQKVMLILLTVVLTSLSISGWMAFKEEEASTLKQIQQRGNDISRFVAKSLGFSVVGYDYHTIQLLLDEIVVSEEINYAKVVNKKGNTMGEAGNFTDTSGMVLFSQDIKLEDESVGKLVIGFSSHTTLARLEATHFNLLKREGLIILFIGIAEFLALSFLIIRPVTIMSRTLDNSVDDNGRVVAKLPVSSNDEFGQLASLFNDMGEQLNKANESLQSKVELADQELIKTNQQLVAQSEELQRLNLEFKNLSITDALTGLYNRRHFEDLLENEMEISNRYGDVNSLLVIDLDFFKKINDTFGHPCGDHVLKEISTILQKCCRKNDILCRVGGEEFVAICRRASRSNSRKIAEKLRQAIESSTILYNGELIQLTASIGVATSCPKDTSNGSLCMYRRADSAVYYSKEHGRNCVTHFDDMMMAENKLLTLNK